MKQDIRNRCREFLKQPSPPDLGYVAGRVAEQVLGGYAAGRAPACELLELLEIAIASSGDTAKELGGAAAACLLARAAMLEEIAGEA